MSSNENAPAVNGGALETNRVNPDTSGRRRHHEAGAAQYPPVGPIPTNARLLVSCLLWADVRTILGTAQLVRPDDVDEPHTTILAAIYSCAHAGHAGPQLVLDRLVRDGDASRPVRDELENATTAGGRPEWVRDHAAAVLGERFRAACESYGAGIVGWSATGSECELWTAITTHGATLRKLADRLAAARGGDL